MSSILEKCGDIDDAIRQLTSLKLTAERKAAAAEAATTVTDDAGERPNFPVHLTPRERTRPAGARLTRAPPSASHSRAPVRVVGRNSRVSNQHPPPGFVAQIRDLRRRLTSRSPPSLHPRPAGDANGQTQKEKHAATAEEEARRAVEAAERKAAETQLASARASNLEAAAPATLSRDWVAALVQEMQSAADVDDAHARATRVMQAFEAAVRGAVAAEGEEGAGGAEGARRRTQLARLAEENLILKRAVAIQNARQQENGELQRQLLELQRACAGYQEQLQAARRENYSLGVHLKEALSPNVPSHRNPDVF